jgi:hypothetical protein
MTLAAPRHRRRQRPGARRSGSRRPTSSATRPPRLLPTVPARSPARRAAPRRRRQVARARSARRLTRRVAETRQVERDAAEAGAEGAGRRERRHLRRPPSPCSITTGSPTPVQVGERADARARPPELKAAGPSSRSWRRGSRRRRGFWRTFRRRRRSLEAAATSPATWSTSAGQRSARRQGDRGSSRQALPASSRASPRRRPPRAGRRRARRRRPGHSVANVRRLSGALGIARKSLFVESA